MDYLFVFCLIISWLQNVGVEERNSRDASMTLSIDQERLSNIALARKAELYEKFVKTGLVSDSFLVDFERKGWDLDDMGVER